MKKTRFGGAFILLEISRRKKMIIYSSKTLI